MAHTYQHDSVADEYLRRADLTGERVQGHSPGYAVPGISRRARRKKVSTFGIIIFLFGFAVASVLYINNIISVNTLMKDINKLDQQYESIRNTNEILRADFNRLTALDNIGAAAFERLGLQYPKEPPLWISIDKKDVDRLSNEFQKKQNR